MYSNLNGLKTTEMKTPKEFLNNLNLYDGNNDHFKNAHAIYKTSQLMDMYAKEYHQEQLKLLNIDNVSKCEDCGTKVDEVYCDTCIEKELGKNIRC